MSILIIFIRINFHHKDSILVAVITGHSPVVSSITIKNLWQLLLQGLFTFPGLHYSENHQ